MKRLIWIGPAVMLAASVGLFVASRKPAPAPVVTANGQEAELRKRIAELEQELERVREAAAQAGTPLPAVVRPRAVTPVPSNATTEDLQRSIEERDRTIAGLEQTVEGLREKVTGFEKQVAELQDTQSAEARRREAEWKEKLETTERQSKQLLSDLEARNDRLRKLEAAGLEARKQSEESLKQLAALRQTAEELDTLTRRREAYFNNIHNRYREATDLFRTMTLRLDSMREGTAVAGNDLSRIQHAITLADEDLRQLRALQTRAAQLQRDVQKGAQGLKRP